MDLKVQNSFLKVDDPDKAIAFYRDALGFEVRNDVGYGDLRWVTVGPPSQPDVSIVLEPPVADPGTTDADRSAIGDLLAKGLLGGLVLTTADLGRTFEHVEASGADVVQEPMDQDWGVRDFAVRDPSGNLIRIGQAKG
jgi:catechol 2,3-dioxygenase-like lactoylglutathione lyase family enzyme